MEGIISQCGTSTLIILSAVLLLSGYAIYLWVFKTTKRLPPGPREWGTTLKIHRANKDAALHHLAEEWARKYGPMTYINYLGQKFLFLNNTDISRRLLASDEYKLLVADRTPTTPTRIGSYNGKDWVFTAYDSKLQSTIQRVVSLFLKVYWAYVSYLVFDKYQVISIYLSEHSTIQVSDRVGLKAQINSIVLKKNTSSHVCRALTYS